MTAASATPHPLRVHLTLLCVTLAFGTNFPFTKEVVGVIPPRAWVCYRLVMASAVLLPLALWRHHRTHGGLPRATGRGRLPWGHLCLAGLLGVSLNMGLFTEGIARTLPGNSAVLNSMIPLFTFLFAVALRHEMFTPGKLLAPIIGLTGVAVLMQVDVLLAGGGLANPEHQVGNFLNLLNGMAFAMYLVVARSLTRKMDPLLVTALAFVLGLVPITAWAWPDLNAESLRGLLSVWDYALFLVLIATVITYQLNNWALQHAPSSQVAMYIVLQPVVATCLSYAMGLQALGGRFLLALALVIVSLLIRVVGEQGARRRRLRGAVT